MLLVSSYSEHRFICRRQRGAPSQLTAVWLCVAESLFGSVGKKKEQEDRCLPALFGSPCWTRTNDPAVNSRMLYRLS